MVAHLYVPFFPLIPSPELPYGDSSATSSRAWCLLPPQPWNPGLGLAEPLALLGSDQLVTRKAADGLILLNSDTRRS